MTHHKKRGKQATPKQKDIVVVTVRIPNYIHAHLCRKSAEYDISLNQMFLDSIDLSPLIKKTT